MTRNDIDPHMSYIMHLVFHAFRDTFGFKDAVEDIKTTLRGERMDYDEFEPSQGRIRQGAGSDHRIPGACATSRMESANPYSRRAPPRHARD